jgi:ABC-2 type transport system permease protein
MNTPFSAIPNSPLDPQGITPGTVLPATQTRPMYWSIRRELWENRSIYIAPLVVAGVVLIGFLIATIGRAVVTVDPGQKVAVFAERNDFAAGAIMVTAFIVAVFYCLDALHGERRDRTILFWKSLPVSDFTTVLSKAAIPLVILPLLTFAIIVCTQLIMLMLSSAALLISGLSAAPSTPWPQATLVLLYHLVTVHVLWHAPIYAWLLLVSGWARRATFLWAVLPPIAIGIIEKIAFNTSYFASMLLHRLTGPEHSPLAAAGSAPAHPMMTFDPADFLSAPGLWIGLAFAAAFLAAAIRLRRYREAI